jgi:hypothetical protein
MLIGVEGLFNIPQTNRRIKKMNDAEELKLLNERRAKRLEVSFQRVHDAKRIDDVDEFVFDLLSRINILASLHKNETAERWGVERQYSFG